MRLKKENHNSRTKEANTTIFERVNKKMRKKLLALVLVLIMLFSLALSLPAVANNALMNNSNNAAPVLTTTVFAEDWRETINIRFFLDGVLTALPLEDIVFIVDGVQIANIRDYTINVAGWQTSTNAVFISKLVHNWQHIVVNISAYGQTVTHEFTNNMFVAPPPPPVLTTTVFAEDWRTTINIRFFLDGVLTALPLEDIVFIVDGVEIPDIRPYTVNVAGWQTETTAVFINKLAHNWQHIIVHISAYGQTVTHEFINNMFVPPRTLTTTVYAEGWRDTINIRFFLDGELAELPLEDIVFIVDGVEVPDIRAFTVNVAGWQTSTSAVFINKQAAWQHIIVHISAYGQTVTHEFTNNMFVTGNPVAPLEDNGIVAVEVDGEIVVIENPRSVTRFVYVKADPVNHGRIVFGEATFDNATQEWVSVRIQPPSDVDVVIAHIRADVRAATVLPETRVSRNIPTFDSNLRRLPCRTRVLITLVLPELPAE